MRSKIVITLLLLFFYSRVNAQDSVISGTWYSKDGSRQYHIRENEQGWEAILVHSRRENDTAGKLVLNRLQKKKNRYRGIIYSTAADLYTTVTIRASGKNKDVLILKLKRMLLLDVTIKWYRDPL